MGFQIVEVERNLLYATVPFMSGSTAETSYGSAKAAKPAKGEIPNRLTQPEPCVAAAMALAVLQPV